MALTPDIAGPWMPDAAEQQPGEGAGVMPVSPFEAAAMKQQVTGAVDSRRITRPKVNRPPSGKIDWRDLQKEKTVKVKNGR